MTLPTYTLPPVTAEGVETLADALTHHARDLERYLASEARMPSVVRRHIEWQREFFQNMLRHLAELDAEHRIEAAFASNGHDQPKAPPKRKRRKKAETQVDGT